MSVSFHGVGENSLDLNNGLATRLLVALGHDPGMDSAGSMSLAGIRDKMEAAFPLLDSQDLEYLEMLRDIIEELKEAGHTTLTWS